MSNELIEINVDGDTITIDEEKKSDLNILAKRFYRLMGYESTSGSDFSASSHPTERLCFRLAVEAYYLQESVGIFD